MPWRYALFVTPVDARWRVSVLDEVATAPERLCDVDDHQEAVRRAREMAAELRALGDDVFISEGVPPIDPPLGGSASVRKLSNR